MHVMQPKQRAPGQRKYLTAGAALLAVALLVCTLAFVDFGRLMWTQTVLNSAAAEAVRLAVLPGPSDAAVADLAVQHVLEGGVETAPSVQVDSRSPNKPVSVTVSVGFDFLVLADLAPKTLGHRTLSSTSVLVGQP